MRIPWLHSDVFKEELKSKYNSEITKYLESLLVQMKGQYIINVQT